MQDHFAYRRYIIQGFFCLVSTALVFKCFQIQVWDTSYRTKAVNTAVNKLTLYPSRGLIYDRNEQLIVSNEAKYDLMVVYKEVKEIDTLKFCKLLNITEKEFVERIEKDWKNIRYSKSSPFPFIKKISKKVYSKLQESLYEFPGFYVQTRNVRNYPIEAGAHVLGFLREVNQQEIDTSEVYQLGDYIGVQGMEYVYEKALRGEKGKEFVLKNNLGRTEGAYEGGDLDKPAESGRNVITTLDMDLQAYGEQLMQNKRGGIVAIEPSTGEILAMISAPSYAPSLLSINRDRGNAFVRLLEDENKPLLDRAIKAQYPPGSIFKTVMGLVAMQEGVWDENKGVSCPGYFDYGGKRPMGCHGHTYPRNMKTALQHSCNAYFGELFRTVIDQYGYKSAAQGLDTLAAWLDKFGLGQRIGGDIFDEKKGNIPDSKYYNKIYKGPRWRSPTIISLSIGQGETQMTTLQMANLAAIIANKGRFVAPHLGKALINEAGEREEIPYFLKETGVDERHFQSVIEGMELAVSAGTATRAQVPGVAVCGKTGTSENPHGEDHSVLFAFAPKENPQIALAVFIENAGFGGTYAAPITSLMIEKYLKGEISKLNERKQEAMLNANLLKVKKRER